MINFDPRFLLYGKIKIKTIRNSNYCSNDITMLPEILLLGRYVICHGFDDLGKYRISYIVDELNEEYLSSPSRLWINKFHKRLEKEFPEILL